MKIREFTGSKGRVALGASAVAVITAIAASIKTLEPEVAITLIVMFGLVAIAYIWSTAHEDGKKAEMEKESIRSMVKKTDEPTPREKE
jgi:peptidoglycan/LPS O-acetylase OafA/YrhL